ncbi:MAG: rRNA maturation RNase YbeY [Thermodesulfobacteriota bacterium]|nr:MAG: rRNA maturation RNase YbeY [Candidatus Dadabacteria bacterium]|tara:strand:+ start:126463 stop:126882 length:420 start_codon:yes stop_codon:yes gene_type:complete
MPLLINDSNIKIKSINKTLLKKTLIKTMEYLNIENRHIDITFINDSQMKMLNRKYAKKNISTDVLSFSVEGYDKELLGNIFISLNYAKKNTFNNSNSLVKEVKILCIHGILHLLGYDHSNKKSEKVMFDLQEKLYEKFR